MKCVIALCLIPVVMVLSAPAAEKRFFVDSLAGLSLFDTDVLKCDLQKILDVVGNDGTEQACEAECNVLVADGSLLTYGCPLMCKSFQSLVHRFSITPGTNDCSGPTTVSG